MAGRISEQALRVLLALYVAQAATPQAQVANEAVVTSGSTPHGRLLARTLRMFE